MEFYETVQDPMGKASPSSKGDCLYRFYPIILDWKIYKIMIFKDKKNIEQKKPLTVYWTSADKMGSEKFIRAIGSDELTWKFLW